MKRSHAAVLAALLSACASDASQPSTESRSELASAVSLQVVDLSGPQRLEGKAVGVTETGYILGWLKPGVGNVYWPKSTATSSAATVIGPYSTTGTAATSDIWSDGGVVDQGDAVGSTGIFRATQGGPPWSYEAAAVPPGTDPSGPIYLNGANAAGVLVGSINLATGGGDAGTLAARWPSAATQPVQLADPANLPGTASARYAQDANDAGSIVGYVRRRTSRTRLVDFAVVWTGASSIPVVLQAPFPNGRAFAINREGVIAGVGITDRNAQYLLRWRPNADGSYSAPEVSPQPTPTTPALGRPAIDACGRIVHGSLVWTGAQVITLTPLAGQSIASATDIANDGTIVGSSQTPSTSKTPWRLYPTAWVGLGPCP